MAITVVNKSGLIKGTNKKYVMKVKIISPIKINGKSSKVGSVITLEGDDLAFLLGRKAVEPVVEDDTEKEEKTLTTKKESSLVKGKKKNK